MRMIEIDNYKMALNKAQEEIKTLQNQLQQKDKVIEMLKDFLIECKAYVVRYKYDNAINGKDFSDALELQKKIEDLTQKEKE